MTGVLALAWLRNALMRTASFAALWAILTEGDPNALGYGLAVVGAAVAASLWLQRSPGGRLHWIALFRFLPVFLWGSLRGGMDVALRAIHPRLPLAPALQDYPLRIPDGPGRVLLIDVISLMPGTLSADLRGDTLAVHVLDGRQPVLPKIQALEERAAALFGLTLEPVGPEALPP
jgi:multicomponent Na+:H+ antiporter subunit E